ncbi:hypothetical protein P7K49_005175 [Saguinus oedipus]|uniref:Uncharacterized protein n=1 Tax=Saguinus oedipus TaxID=9490 RepID=A0ABQ9W9J1_SAGOE|nr:hypothetical protein P7K49_005175 [Saguinus oedipus]
MLARGGGEGVTEEYRPANKERVPAPRPRPAPPGSPPRSGRHRARCGRRRRAMLQRAPRGLRSPAPLARPPHPWPPSNPQPVTGLQDPSSPRANLTC